MGWIVIIIFILIIVGGILYYLSTQNGAIPPGVLNNNGNSSATSTPTPTQQTATTTALASTTSAGVPMIPYYTLAIKTSPTLGQYLTAADGMTLYVYAHDSNNKSACTGTCSVIWPPYTVLSTNALTVGPHLAGKIGFITRANGTKQVTYNGAPLYFYEKDIKPGETLGNGILGLWSVAKP